MLKSNPAINDSSSVAAARTIKDLIDAINQVYQLSLVDAPPPGTVSEQVWQNLPLTVTAGTTPDVLYVAETALAFSPFGQALKFRAGFKITIRREE